MKTFIKILFLVNTFVFLYGLYLQYIARNSLYEKVMGSGVLLLVFGLLPLFLYHRYKDKSIDDYRFKGFNNDKENK